MTDLRVIQVTPPAGEWVAVALREAATPDGPWETVQAARVDGAGSRSIAFRPRIADGFYSTLWVAEGGSRSGLAEGEVQRLPGARSASRGKVARVGGGGQ